MLTSRGKEVAQQCPRRGLRQAAINLGRVMAGRLGENARSVVDAAALLVPGTVVKPRNARQRHRLGAHRTGLQGHIKIAAAETLVTKPFGGGANHQHFGVGRRVPEFNHPVAIARHHCAAPALDNDGADRDLGARAGGLRFLERQRHRARCPRFFIRGRHGGKMAAPPRPVKRRHEGLAVIAHPCCWA